MSVPLPTASDWPTVTCLILAYNYGPFLAECVESALGQEYPADKLEVIVVDDGSTDDTPEVLAAFGDRIRVIRQENAGVNAAMTRGMLAATGELIALLDADDAWKPDKLRHQVPPLLERPEVGFVYSDFTCVDASGKVLAPSYFEQRGVRPPSGNVLGLFVRQCMSWGSTIVIRASLVDELLPVPAEASFQDAYVSARAAELCEFAYVPRQLMRYRVHGDNAWAQASGEKLLRNTRKDAAFLRWLLLNRPLEGISVEDLTLAYTRLVWLFNQCSRLSGRPVQDEVRPEERRGEWRDAMIAAGAARARDDAFASLRAYISASACDPLDPLTRRALDAALYDTRERQSAEALVVAAEERFGSGEALEALEELRSVARAEGATGGLAARIHNDIAVIAAGLGRREEAEAEALRALELKSDYAPALETLAWLREEVPA